MRPQHGSSLRFRARRRATRREVGRQRAVVETSWPAAPTAAVHCAFEHGAEPRDARSADNELWSRRVGLRPQPRQFTSLSRTVQSHAIGGRQTTSCGRDELACGSNPAVHFAFEHGAEPRDARSADNGWRAAATTAVHFAFEHGADPRDSRFGAPSRSGDLRLARETERISRLTTFARTGRHREPT